LDKFVDSGFTKEDSEKIDCPRIKEAMGYVECEVIDEIETGDHIIYIGKVVHSEEKTVGQRLLQGGHSDFTTTI
jgi:flavin reductase (DIM6/NTAB) family NADH-FMN oxidoreductase RutF